jgi:hypothetical protein
VLQADDAEAFTTRPGRCFRLVHPNTVHAQFCPNRVTTTGEFTDSNGKTWTVDACAAHPAELKCRRKAQPRSSPAYPDPGSGLRHIEDMPRRPPGRVH